MASRPRGANDRFGAPSSIVDPSFAGQGSRDDLGKAKAAGRDEDTALLQNEDGPDPPALPL